MAALFRLISQYHTVIMNLFLIGIKINLQKASVECKLLVKLITNSGNYEEKGEMSNYIENVSSLPCMYFINMLIIHCFNT